MQKNNLKLNIVLNMVYQIFIMLTPLITAPYLARVLGADGIGVFSYTGSIQTYFTLFAALGTVSYGTRAIAQKRNDKSELSKLFWEIEIITVITTSVCLIAWLIFAFQSDEYRIIFLILSINIFAVMFDISWLYAGLELFSYSIFVNIAFRGLQIVLLFAFVKTENDIPIYTFITALCGILGTIAMWVFLPKTICRTTIKGLKPFSHLKEIWIYFVPTIATTIYTTLDKTLIGVITGSDAENGYYEQATKIIHMAQAFTIYSVNAVFASRNSFLFSENKFDEVKGKISSTMDYILFMGIGICFGLLGVADRFVPWFFGDGYEKVALLLKCFAPIVFIIGISNCLGSQYYTPAGKRLQSARYIVIGAIANTVLNLFFIPYFQSMGAVVASVVAELIIATLYLSKCNGYYSFKLLILQLWKKLIAALIMFALICAVDYFISSDLLALFIEVCIGLILYILLLFLMKDSLVCNVIEAIKRKRKKNESPN